MVGVGKGGQSLYEADRDGATPAAQSKWVDFAPVLPDMSQRAHRLLRLSVPDRRMTPGTARAAHRGRSRSTWRLRHGIAGRADAIGPGRPRIPMLSGAPRAQSA